MCTQPRDPNNKNKPAYKQYYSYCHRTNHSISACFKRHRDDEDKGEAYARSKSPQNHLYNTFVLPQMIEQNAMIYDTEVDVQFESLLTTKRTIHKKDLALHLEIDLDMTKVPFLHFTLHHDMITIRETRDLIALFIDPYTNHPINVTLVTDIDHALIHEITTISQDIHLLLTTFETRDSRLSRSRSHSNTRTKLNTIQSKTQNDPINFEVYMYSPTEMANGVTPTSWFYSLYTLAPLNQSQRDYPSRLEFSVLLDSGAYISVLKFPTYINIAELPNIKQNDTLNASKTLTVANQTEVPILHYDTVT